MERCGAVAGEKTACDAATGAHSVRPGAPGAWHPECGSGGQNAPEISSKILRHGGPRANAGGARENSGGRREGAGRRPKERSAEAEAPRCGGMRWLCVETLPRREFQVIVELHVLGLEPFAPVYIPSGKPKDETVLDLAFPGYVLVRADLDGDAWRLIHSRPGVLGLLQHDAERPMVIAEAVAERMLRTYGGDGVAAQRPEGRARLRKWAPVRIEEGPFTGFPATVVEDRGERVALLVNIMGRKVPCDVLWSSIEAV